MLLTREDTHSTKIPSAFDNLIKCIVEYAMTTSANKTLRQELNRRTTMSYQMSTLS